MTRLAFITALIQIFFLTGCAAHIGAPQSRTEFVRKVKPGGIGRKAEHVTVNRPFQSVLSDMKQFSSKCLEVRVTRPGSYRLKEVGGSTTYHPKIIMLGENSASLQLQEEYGSKRANSGAPPGGLFVLVTEFRAAGSNKTRVDIYHLYKGEIVKPMVKWISNEKRECPSF